MLLDSTPLANELKEIAGIDLRTMFRHGKRRVRVLLVSVLIAFLGVPAATAVFSDWPLPLAQFAFMDDHLPVPPPLPPPPIGGASWPSSLHVPVPVLPPPVGVPPTVGSVPRPEAPPEPLPAASPCRCPCRPSTCRPRSVGAQAGAPAGTPAVAHDGAPAACFIAYWYFNPLCCRWRSVYAAPTPRDACRHSIRAVSIDTSVRLSS